MLPEPSTSQARPISPTPRQCASNKCLKPGGFHRTVENSLTASSVRPAQPVRSNLVSRKQLVARALQPRWPKRSQSLKLNCFKRGAPRARFTTRSSLTQSPQHASEIFSSESLDALHKSPNSFACSRGQPARPISCKVVRPLARAARDRFETWKQPSSRNTRRARASRARASMPSKPKPRSTPSVNRCIWPMSKCCSCSPRAAPRTLMPTSVQRRAPRISTFCRTWQWSASARHPAFVILSQFLSRIFSRVAPAWCANQDTPTSVTNSQPFRSNSFSVLPQPSAILKMATSVNLFGNSVLANLSTSKREQWFDTSTTPWSPICLQCETSK